ncbi:MAG: dTDP-4-dehydrorhamnose 3,5-epimerase [Bacteroidales bacterium]
MNIINTDLEGLKVIELSIFNDQRGYFFESYNENRYTEAGIYCRFVQDNQSKSSSGVIRGLHYQLEPHAQSKLIRVLQGKIYDVVVDIRNGSPTFGKHYGIELSEDNQLQLFIPKGFAHGFSVLSPTAVILYKCDVFYNPGAERGIVYNDKTLAIDWKIKAEEAIVSDKDKILPELKYAEINFTF